MDKLRRFGQALWRIKERMVFAIMVIILSVSVYQVVKEPEPDPSPPYPVPGTGEMEVPMPEQVPPPGVNSPSSSDINELRRNNPFQYNPSGSDAEPDVDFELVAIMGGAGNPVARLRVQGRRENVREGDTVSGYNVTSIDVDNESVTLRNVDTGAELSLTRS